ncbi:MAG: amidohydrolase [Candidatus Aramenus sp.]|nr:amidohydrolase [Candidatus Aramenus sp.]
MRILLKAALAMTDDAPLKNIYIGVNGERVEVISREQPEDYENAELSIGGNNRIVSPGFVSLQTFLFLYPFRYRIFSGKVNVNDLISVMNDKDFYYFSLLASYHLLKTGVTTVVVADPEPEHSARAVNAVGLNPLLAVSAGCSWAKGDWKKEFKTLYSRWSTSEENKVLLRLCDEGEAEEVFGISREYKVPVLVERSVDLSRFKDIPKNVIALGGASRKDFELVKKTGIQVSFTPTYEVCKFTLGALKPSISLDISPKYDIRSELGYATLRLLLTPEEAFKSATKWGYSQLGMNVALKVGSVGDVIVFELTEPPSYPLDLDSPYESLVYSSYTVETSIVKGEVVLDGGIPLNVGTKDIEEAQGRIEEVDEKYRSMEKN